MKAILKGLVNGFFLLLTWPAAALSGFGRVTAMYRMFAHLAALAPGLPGDCLRVAYYRWTLARCPLDSRVEFGSFFAHPQAEVGRWVYIGPYCVFGRARIGDRTQIAAGVQILSGKRQHARTPGGAITGAEHGIFETVSVGADCWLGAAAIVMADVGEGATVGAGSVVTRPVPARSVAAGNPARVLAPPGGAEPA